MRCRLPLPAGVRRAADVVGIAFGTGDLRAPAVDLATNTFEIEQEAVTSYNANAVVVLDRGVETDY